MKTLFEYIAFYKTSLRKLSSVESLPDGLYFNGYFEGKTLTAPNFKRQGS